MQFRVACGADGVGRRGAGGVMEGRLGQWPSGQMGKRPSLVNNGIMG